MSTIERRLTDLFGQSNFTEVIKLYEKIEYSENIQKSTIFLAGVAYQKNKKFHAAIKCYTICINANFNKLACLYNQANSFLAVEMFDEAALACDTAIDQGHPNIVSLVRLYLKASLQSSNTSKIEDYINEKLADKDHQSSRFELLGELSFLKGKYKVALDFFKSALGCAVSNHDECKLGIADCLRKLFRYREAIKIYEEILSSSQRPNAFMFNNLGSCWLHLRNLDTAETYFQKAIRFDATFASAYNNMGMLYHISNKNDQATQFFAKALEYCPKDPSFMRNYTLTKKFNKSSSSICSAILNIEDNSILKTPEVHFAQGKIFDDLGQYSDALCAYQRGNAIRKAKLDYSIEKDRKKFDKIMIDFEAHHISDSIEFEPRPIPIFIVGLPRSGTSLLEQIISNHPSVSPLGEVPTFGNIGNEVFNLNTAVTNELIRGIRNSYYSSYFCQGVRTPFFTDKLPSNFQWIGLIRQAIPEAKIIFITRHLEAVMWSNFVTYYPTEGNGFAYDLSDIAAYYYLYIELKQFWESKFEDLISINYEDLIAKPELHMSRIFRDLGLDYYAELLDISRNENHIFTASAAQARTRIYSNANARWKNYNKAIQAALTL